MSDAPQDQTLTAEALFARLHEFETGLARLKGHLAKAKATALDLQERGLSEAAEDCFQDTIKIRKACQELEEMILTTHTQLVRLPVIDENFNVNTGLVQLAQSL